MNAKMSGKQDVVGGFDLEAFANAPDEPAPKSKASRGGRRKPAATASPPTDKVTERVQVMLTKSEITAIQKKAGLAPISKWLRHELKEKGIC